MFLILDVIRDIVMCGVKKHRVYCRATEKSNGCINTKRQIYKQFFFLEFTLQNSTNFRKTRLDVRFLCFDRDRSNKCQSSTQNPMYTKDHWS